MDTDDDDQEVVSKRRTQSLSALPKDEPKSPRKVLTHLISRGRCDIQRHIVEKTVNFASDQRERSHQATNERIYDILQATPSASPPATPQPGQPYSQQDSWGMVVRAGATGETEIPRLSFPGLCASSMVPQ